jgi:hypothetical protein
MSFVSQPGIPPVIFDLSALEPPLDLPLINFRRVNIPSDIPVPPLIGNDIENAKTQLKSIGLESDSRGVAVQENSGEPLNIVIGQDPPAGTKVPPKTRVSLTYNYVASDRFGWVVPLPNDNIRDFIRLGG